VTACRWFLASFLKSQNAVKISAMTRTDLIHALAYRFRHLTADDAEDAVKEILGGIGAALARSDRVETRDFGSFSLNYRAPRAGRNTNPYTGQQGHVNPYPQQPAQQYNYKNNQQQQPRQRNPW